MKYYADVTDGLVSFKYFSVKINIWEGLLLLYKIAFRYNISSTCLLCLHKYIMTFFNKNYIEQHPWIIL